MTQGTFRSHLGIIWDGMGWDYDDDDDDDADDDDGDGDDDADDDDDDGDDNGGTRFPISIYTNYRSSASAAVTW